MRVALLIFLPILLVAQSQPPAPAPGKVIQNNQQKAVPKQAVAANDQSNTDSISAAIDKLASEVAAWKKQSYTQHEKSNAPSEGWIIWSTVVTAVSTFFIAILGFRQWRTMEGQRQAMNAQGGHMQSALVETKKAADAAKDSAQAAISANATAQEATDLTRQSLILTHRPKIVVRAFFVHGDMSALKEGSGVDGAFEVSNIGGTRATVTEVYATAIMLGFLPMKRPYEDGSPGHKMPEPKHLNPGESMRATFRKNDGALQQGDVSEIVGPSRNSRSLYVLGFVRYHDDLDPPTPRRTAFCRRFDRSTVRFTPAGDEDYENAD